MSLFNNYILELIDYRKCFQICIEDQYIKQYECFPNPFIYEDFILINSNQTEHRICDQNKTDFKINENICDKQCIKDCKQIYFKTRFDNSLVLKTKESKISIKFRNSIEFIYESEKKYSFTDFMSNIGGLFGLYFGLSFVDMSQMFPEYSWNHFKRYSNSYLLEMRFDFIIICKNESNSSHQSSIKTYSEKIVLNIRKGQT